MSHNQSVKVSSRYQIAIPSAVRKRLDIQAGDRLLVDVQDDVIVLVPKPSDYTEQISGLYKEIWEKPDSDQYISDERDTADSLHVATAIASGATAWISNDKQHRRLSEWIDIVLLDYLI